LEPEGIYQSAASRTWRRRARLAFRGNLAAGFGGRGRRLGGEGLVVGFKLVVVDVSDAACAAAAAAVARERLLRHRRGIRLRGAVVAGGGRGGSHGRLCLEAE
jgi:hypothetical protein